MNKDFLIFQIVKEQTQNKQLSAELKEKDVTNRRIVEENELLLFNNQRLTKRLSALQEDFVGFLELIFIVDFF